MYGRLTEVNCNHELQNLVIKGKVQCVQKSLTCEELKTDSDELSRSMAGPISMSLSLKTKRIIFPLSSGLVNQELRNSDSRGAIIQIDCKQLLEQLLAKRHGSSVQKTVAFGLLEVAEFASQNAEGVVVVSQLQ